ncbi:hypothetical protein M413DRAFT_192195 [Hebeloma cylindrosporum]|uniref:Uncharacterized protein n=1 Tax=Hebeloma cylindrosporum TaxID=76867 RepID=A0A0C2YEN4_HEBCY|nr:hypothetical protein M413DRAFT_192195 [Hebeloma cylindrosporum h7]
MLDASKFWVAFRDRHADLSGYGIARNLRQHGVSMVSSLTVNAHTFFFFPCRIWGKFARVPLRPW